jgi:competence protein ComEA
MMPSPDQPPWGWIRPTRALLAILALAGALGLAVSDPKGRESATAAPELVVDLNTAPAEVLASLPGLGPTLVARIIAARRQAPFRSLEDLDRRVRGIGPATTAALRPHLYIDQ